MQIHPQPSFEQNLDSIVIDDLCVRTVIGVNDWERKIEQNISISLILKVDIKKASIGDNIENTVDYEKISNSIVNVVEKSRCYLVEKLANEVAKHILTNFDVKAVMVRLEKPGALRCAKTVGVEIWRNRKDFDL